MASLPSTLIFSSPKYPSIFTIYSPSTCVRLISPQIFPIHTPLQPSPRKKVPHLPIRALALDFSGSFFEGGRGEDEGEPPSAIAVDDKEEPQCPSGLRQYETMVVLRPDMSEEERLSLTQKYDEYLLDEDSVFVGCFVGES
ncbi:translation elongation factor EF1B/ribosomal protein S6 family protein [Tasmannia lanceolata]|uniref:translation elongation factor EF1B/ribosomal protein S6 family protein n=1 Tax=Tasmannia lanceolata TaxID=3420 RepID=UPI004064817D